MPTRTRQATTAATVEMISRESRRCCRGTLTLAAVAACSYHHTIVLLNLLRTRNDVDHIDQLLLHSQQPIQLRELALTWLVPGLKSG